MVRLRSEARILLQVRVRTELVQGDRVQIEMRIRRHPAWLVALPRPEEAVPSEHAEPNQIGPAAGLQQQLTAPLGQEGVERHLGRRDVVRRRVQDSLRELAEARDSL